MNETNFKRTKFACYYAYLSMASVFSMPPILFVVFRNMYNISYTLLGTLVLINFSAQLLIDLLFSFFAKHFNIPRAVKIMPILTCIGLLIYAIIPSLFPNFAYLGLVLGTIVFSIAAGLSEVLLSPLIAAMPSETTGRDVSKLHSLYAWGVLSVVIITTVFLSIFGEERWIYLTVLLSLPPLGASYLFCTSPLPEMTIGENGAGGGAKKKHLALALCFMCIFFGSAAEVTMSNWISEYMESALNIPKTVGDIFGMAIFALLLGGGRTLYAKYGKHIWLVLTISMGGAFVCYLIAGLSPSTMLAFFACVLTGCFTSMLWPGTLIYMEEILPDAGVVAYALMAAGGDLGASAAPQLMGIVVDITAGGKLADKIGAIVPLSPEQIGMRAGMLTTALFPLLGVLVLIYMRKYFKKKI